LVYKAFERAIVLVLTLPIVLVVALATWRLAAAVFHLVITSELGFGNQKVFQSFFEMIFSSR
jgi:hypothetical protein